MSVLLIPYNIEQNKICVHNCGFWGFAMSYVEGVSSVFMYFFICQLVDFVNFKHCICFSV